MQSNREKQHGADAFAVIEHVPVQLHAELGRKKMSFGELLNLKEGDVVALPRPAGDPVDVFVAGSNIGQGEVLMVNGAMAIRVAALAIGEADRRKQ
jgi:flagellar motor switch protein FliN